MLNSISRRRASRGILSTSWVLAAGTLVTAVALLTTGCQVDVPGDPGQRLDEYMSRLEGTGFSGAALVASGGRILLQEGYGAADRESGRLVTPETVFTIGSITKQFTGAAILKLEMMGRLETSDLISDHFEGVPADKAEITLHHLLTHSAGFLAPSAPISTSVPKRPRSWLKPLPPTSSSNRGRGTNTRTSDSAYWESSSRRVSGIGYEEFLRQHLFQPAGMARTGYLLPGYEEENLAVGYREGARWGSVVEKPMLPDGPSWHLRANGGIHSTLGDMLRWQQALESNTILSQEAKDRYLSPWIDEGGGDSFYGYGWVNMPDYMGRKLITHNGGNGIFSADFRWFPDDDVVICAFTNLSDFSPVDYVTRDLTRLMFGAEVNLPPATETLDPVALEAKAGTYLLETGGSIEVQTKETSLLLTGSGSDAEALLTGGSGGGTSPRATALKARSEDILRREYGGDFTGIHEALGGQMSLEEITAEEMGWMGMREERLWGLPGFGGRRCSRWRRRTECLRPHRLPTGSRLHPIRLGGRRIGRYRTGLLGPGPGTGGLAHLGHRVPILLASFTGLGPCGIRSTSGLLNSHRRDLPDRERKRESLPPLGACLGDEASLESDTATESPGGNPTHR